MRKIYILFTFHFLLLTLYSQSITWQRLYNGPGYNIDGGRSICSADSGNFYVVGYTQLNSSFFSKRIYVLKLNPLGDTIWTRIIGNDTYGGPVALAVVPSGNGGCVITGSWYEAFAIEISPSGAIIWQKFYGGVAVQLYDLKKTSDGGYIACGKHDFDGYVIKLDSFGNLQWQRTHPAAFTKIFYCVEKAHDSGFILVGYSKNSSQDNAKGIITRISQNGDTLFNKTFSIDTITTAVTILRINNGYLIGGNIGYRVLFNYNRMYFLKVNNNCDSSFAKIFESAKNEYSYDLETIHDNKFVIAGYRDSGASYILNGRVCVFDSVGNIIRERVLPSPDYIIPYSILPLNNGDIVFTGEADFNIGYCDVYVVRTDSLLYAPEIIGGINNIGNVIPKGFKLYQNYPNPFNSQTIIEFEIPSLSLYQKNIKVKIVIYDILGREIDEVVDGTFGAGFYKINYDAGWLSSGVYFYLLETEDYREAKKMVLMK